MSFIRMDIMEVFSTFLIRLNSLRVDASSRDRVATTASPSF